MSPPSATATESHTNGNSHPGTQNGSSEPSVTAPLEPGLNTQQAKVQMPKFPSPPKFEDKYEEREYLKGRLAAAFRIFGKFGFDEGVAGHITLRDPVDPTTFWVNPFGVAFSLIKVSDLIQVDHKGQVIAGGPVKLLNTAAFMIHSAIHEARPDVLCAAHSHSIYGRSFCALGRTLDIITQDACSFHNVRCQKSLCQIVSCFADMFQYRTTHFTNRSTVSFWRRKKAKILQPPWAITRQHSFKITVSLLLVKRSKRRYSGSYHLRNVVTRN